MKARADAVSELEAAGTFEDITALGSGEDDIDRQLKELSSKSAVDDDLAKMKGEIGAPEVGSPPTPETGGGQIGSGTAGDQSKEQSA
jgi:phage shock protein A